MTELEQNLIFAVAIVTLLGSITVFGWQYWRQYGRRRGGRDRDDSPEG